MTGERPPREPRIFDPGDPSCHGPEPAFESPQPDGETAEPEAIATLQVRRGWNALGRYLRLGRARARAACAQSVADAVRERGAFTKRLHRWTAVVLVAIAGLAASAIILREMIGLMRLRRLGRLRRDLEETLDARDAAREKVVLRRFSAHWKAG